MGRRRSTAAARGRGPNPPLRRTRVLVVLLVVLVGCSAALAAYLQAERNAETDQGLVADRVAEAARSDALTAIAGLGGAAALAAPTAEASRETFEAFQRDVSAVSSLAEVGYVTVVPDDRRAQFEAQIGRPVTERSEGAFSLVPAARRDTYWPIRAVSPPGSRGEALLGFDVAADPLTARLSRIARDEGRTVITDPLRISEDDVIFFILKPLYRPDVPRDTVAQRRDSLVGFLVSDYSGSALAAQLREQQAGTVRFAVTDGRTQLAASRPAPAGGVVRRVDVAGQTWSVQVQDTTAVDHQLTLFLLGITAVIVGALVLLIRRSSRYERHVARTNTLVGRTTELARRLAGAATAEEVAVVIGDHLPPVFGARAATFGTVDRPAGVVRIRYGPSMPVEVADRYPELSLGTRTPVATSIASGRLELVPDERTWRRTTDPEVAGAVLGTGLVAMASLPLRVGGDDAPVSHTIGIFWDRRQHFDDLAAATLGTVVELCEQSLERATLTDQVSTRAQALAALAEQLAAATTIADAAAIVTEHGRRPVEATAASIGVVDDRAGVLRTHHGRTVSDEVRRRYADPPLGERLAFTDAARTGQPILIPDWQEYRRRYPDTDPSQAELGEGARAALPLVVDGRSTGAVVFSWSEPRAFDDALVSHLTTIAEMAAQSVHRARLMDAQAADARRSRELARLAEGLAARSHTEDIMTFLVEGLLAPVDADQAAMGLIDGDALRRYLSATEPSPARADLAAEDERWPLRLSTPLTDAARTGRDVFVADAEEFRRTYPDLEEMRRSLDFESVACLTLRDRHGALMGALGVSWDRPMVFDDDLRDRLRTIVGIVAQTLERARLADELLEAAVRNERLADLAQRVARVGGVDELIDAVTDESAAPVGAAVASIGLLDDSHRRVTVRPRSDVAPGVAHEVPPFPVSEEQPGAEAIRTGRAVLLRSPAEIRERCSVAVADALAEAGVEATAHLPLMDRTGVALGYIGFGWKSEQTFRASTVATLRTIAGLCTQTLERARRAEAEHHLVDSIQRRVVAPLPPEPGLDIAERYLPATEQVGMGGDWFEGIPLDGGRYAVVVGDTAGHGFPAIADMIQLRAGIGTLLRGPTPLEVVFPRLTEMLHSSRFPVTASACVVVIDPASSSLRYVSAGHLPCLLRHPDGRVTTLDEGRQPLLGVPSRTVEAGAAGFPPGAVLIAYTDGLVERREEDIDASIARLSGAAEAAPETDPAALADHLIDRCLSDRVPQDDVALVVVRHDAADG